MKKKFNDKIVITKEQFENIEHFKNMFEVNAELVKNICKQERPDIVYGFELGEMHSHLRECFRGMLELIHEIKNQN